jgi:hypothetical protein
MESVCCSPHPVSGTGREERDELKDRSNLKGQSKSKAAEKRRNILESRVFVSTHVISHGETSTNRPATKLRTPARRVSRPTKTWLSDASRLGTNELTSTPASDSEPTAPAIPYSSKIGE